MHIGVLSGLDGKKVFKGIILIAIATHLCLQAVFDSAYMRLSYKFFY